MKKILFVFLILIIAGEVAAQYEDTEKKGLNKENVFSGGSLSVSFLNNTFLIGGSPVLGYKLTRFLDAGIVANYQYVSVRDYNVFDDRLRQSTYGEGYSRGYIQSILYSFRLNWNIILLTKNIFLLPNYQEAIKERLLPIVF